MNLHRWWNENWKNHKTKCDSLLKQSLKNHFDFISAAQPKRGDSSFEEVFNNIKAQKIIIQSQLKWTCLTKILIVSLRLKRIRTPETLTKVHSTQLFPPPTHYFVITCASYNDSYFSTQKRILNNKYQMKLFSLPNLATRLNREPCKKISRRLCEVSNVCLRRRLRLLGLQLKHENFTSRASSSFDKSLSSSHPTPSKNFSSCC